MSKPVAWTVSGPILAAAAAAAAWGLESRDAQLLLRLVDAETGAPVAMEADLWRLGAPEDERWTEGDLEIDSGRVPVEGNSLRDLVPGRYRLHADGQRIGVPDPPEFRIRPGENGFEARVVVARTIPLRLVVRDEEGRRLERGTTRAGGFCSFSNHPSFPDWARPRGEKQADGSVRFSRRAGGASTGCGALAGGERPASAGADGFFVGLWTEERRNRRESWGVRFEFEGHSAVAVGAGGGAGYTGVLVAPSLSRQRILRGVVLEDGGRAVDLDTQVEASAAASWLRPGESEELWRSVPVRAKVTLDGHLPLEFDVRVDDPASARILRRRPPADD